MTKQTPKSKALPKRGGDGLPGGVARSTYDTPVEKRRAFQNRNEWVRQVKADLFAKLDEMLLPLGGEISLTINGDATGEICIDVSEWVSCNGEPSYWFEEINLGSRYMPDPSNPVPPTPERTER